MQNPASSSTGSRLLGSMISSASGSAGPAAPIDLEMLVEEDDNPFGFGTASGSAGPAAPIVPDILDEVDDNPFGFDFGVENM